MNTSSPARRRAALPLAAAALLASVIAVAAPITAPAARDVVETFFGTEVHDPYRWLEDTKAPEVAGWMKSASEQTAATLARIPGRQAMYERLAKYDGSAPARVWSVVRETGDVWFYERRGASENQFKLMMRRGLDGTERALVDPEEIQKRTGKPHAINYYAAAPGGRLVGYGLSKQGSEAAVLHLIDTATGKPVGRPIDRAEMGSPSFSPDGQWMLFTRLQELKKGAPATEKYQRARVFLMRPGANVKTARPVFGTGTPGVEMGPAVLPFAFFSHDGRWAFGYEVNGTQREIGLYAAPADSMLAGKPQWKRVLSASDDVTGVAYMAGKLYMVSHRGAPRSQVLVTDLAAPDVANATVIVPQSDRVVVSIGAASDALYIETRDGNVKRLYKRPYAADAAVTEVALPLAGSFELVDTESFNGAADPRLPGLVLDLQSWNRARQIYLVGADGSVRNSGLQPQGPLDAPPDVVATEVKVKSHDGVLVPMSILHRRDVKLDGRNPTILWGYASYGMSEDPFYSISRMAWIDAGGVFAVANPRGSGVYGEEWYRAGYQATKPNTWKDFIACAEWLVEQKWAAPATLGVMGGSAGGITVGRAITERPDLFAAAVPLVGALDMVRAEVTPNGVPNIPEFGTRKTEAGFRALLAMSTYHQVRDGTKYPAVMFGHGVNDPRVEVWHSTKTAARMMAATASGKPILLRLDYDAGHGVGSTKQQTLQERADAFAFFMWQFGVEGYQPKAP